MIVNKKNLISLFLLLLEGVYLNPHKILINKILKSLHIRIMIKIIALMIKMIIIKISIITKVNIKNLLIVILKIISKINNKINLIKLKELLLIWILLLKNKKFLIMT